jgi:hypothetical protein
LAQQRKQSRQVHTVFAVPVLRVAKTWISLPLGTLSPGDLTTFSWGFDKFLPTPWHIAVRYSKLFWAVFSLLTAIGLVCVLLRRSSLSLVPVCCLLGRLILPFVTILGADPRYMIEAIPCCCVLAAYAFIETDSARWPTCTVAHAA